MKKKKNKSNFKNHIIHTCLVGKVGFPGPSLNRFCVQQDL